MQHGASQPRGPREGAGAGTADHHRASLRRLCLSKCPRSPLEQELEPRPKSPPQEALLDHPALPRHPRRTRSVSVPTAHAGLRSPFISSVPCAANPEPRLSARRVKVQVPHPKDKSHLAKPPGGHAQPAGPVSPFAQRWPLDLVETAFAKPRVHVWVTAAVTGCLSPGASGTEPAVAFPVLEHTGDFEQNAAVS